MARRLGAQPLSALADDALLSLVLGGTDPLAVARSLLKTPRGLRGVAEPTHRPVRLSPAQARRLDAALELGRRVAEGWGAAPWTVRTPADVAERLLPAMSRLPREQLRVATLNTRHAVIDLTTLYQGNLAGCPVRVAEVFEEAVRRGAAAIVVIHNHPSGDPSPSADDLRITADLAAAGRLLDIELLDHLVIGHGRWVSLRALGAMPVASELPGAPAAS